MAKVLIYSLDFPPDNVSTGQLMGELAVDLKRAGHDIAVVTTEPHSNPDAVAAAAQPLKRLWGRFLLESSFHGIRVIHTRMPRRREGVRSRLMGWLGFHAIGLYGALRFLERPDVIIIPSPLLSSAVVGWCLGVATGARYIYNVQELYPDLAIQLGKLRNPALIGLLRLLERFVYRTASAVTVISRGMEEKLLARGVGRGKLHYVPNFVDLDEIAPLGAENEFGREHGLSGAFVASYAGNMGHAQRLDVLLEAADLLRNERSIVFLLVGNGVAMEALKRTAAHRQLPNVKFVGHQPFARVPQIYAASTVSIVPLLETIGADAIPSKVYRIMAAARPVLVIAARDSELATIVRAAEAGVVVGPDPVAVADAIRQLAAMGERGRTRLGEAGRAYALQHVARPIVTGRYAQLVEDLAQSRVRAISGT